jgi:NADH-quinone oxidoreductase subunit H
MSDVLLPTLAVLGTLLAGAALVAVLDQAAAGVIAGGPFRGRLSAPLARAALLWLRPDATTEHPDALLWRLAPAAYLALAALGLAVVPWSAEFVPVRLPTGVVLWGAVEALATVVIFLQGWAPNAPLPLLGAYRHAAAGLSYILVSMFVLIGAALPAESLAFDAVVASQEDLWNVVRQPLGLPLFLVVGLGIGVWGPLRFADAADLAGGTTAETSGPRRLAWALARGAMLVAFSAVAASAFLGGWLGPWLPGPVWLLLKMLLLLALLVLLGRLLARIAPGRFVGLAWLVLLPLSFADLLWAGVLALYGGTP